MTAVARLDSSAWRGLDRGVRASICLVALIACGRESREPPRAEPGRSSSPAAAAPALACGALLDQPEVEAACATKLATTIRGPGERGATCHRIFDGERGTLELIVGTGEPAELRAQYDRLLAGIRAESEHHALIRELAEVPGLGDAAYRYTKGIANAAPRQLVVLHGRQLITIKSHGVLGSRQGLCMHPELAALAGKVISHLP